MSSEAPQSSKPKASSSAVHHELRDTLMAPIEVMAMNDTIHSGKLRMATATRWPLVMP